MTKLSKSFYQREDVVKIARELLGKYLFTRIGNEVTGGMIVETEAYRGYDDRACHANDGRRTKRNLVMYQPGGLSYIYLCYGIHNLFNVVTNLEGRADAVLIRGIQPEQGMEIMQRRRKLGQISKRLTNGPGLVTQALGIGLDHYATDLSGDVIWIEDRGERPEELEVQAASRIGVAYAKEHALYPWRFFLVSNEWVSDYKPADSKSYD